MAEFEYRLDTQCQVTDGIWHDEHPGRVAPAGCLLASSGVAEANPYRFSSEYYDKETEFVSYFYRTYRTDIGRDPIGEKGGLNLYAMVSNNPIDFYDSLGHGIRIKGYDKGEMTGHYVHVMQMLGKEVNWDSVSNLQNYRSFEAYYDGKPPCVCKKKEQLAALFWDNRNILEIVY